MKLVCSVLISALVIAFVQQSLQDDENAIPVVIRRRLIGDIHYSDYPDKFSTCSDGESSNFTYLVEERMCVTSSDLQKECSSLIIPNKTSNLIAVTSASSSTSIATLVIDAGASGGAIFYFKDTEQLINKSVCAIDSLEVYRGREQAIKISHDGFILSNSGAFVINYDETTHSRDEYEGELYRMNLSCFGEGLPESGCLFFKVRGRANITNAKFNCTVPGTLTDFNKECKYTPTTNTISTTTSPSTTLSTTTNSLSPTSGFELGGTYFLIVVVCGVLVVALLIAIVLVCCMVCLLRRKMRPSSAQTDDCCKQQSNLQDLDTKLSPRYHTAVPQEYETLFSNQKMPVTGGEDHTYASLGDPKNPRHYTDPIKINPNKIKRHPNGSVPEKDRRASEPSAQYENPHSIQETSIKPQSREGHSDDVSEHNYAELEKPPPTQSVPRQQLPLLQGGGGGGGGEEHHYDAPPIEDETSLRPHPSDKRDDNGDNDPVNHIYAILENH